MTETHTLRVTVICTDTHCGGCGYLSDERDMDDDIEACRCLLLDQELTADDYNEALRHEVCLAMEKER